MLQCPHRAAWPSVLDQADQQLEEEEEKERIERERGRDGEREGREKYKTYGWIQQGRERKPLM